MKHYIKIHNNTIHSSTNIKPNDFTENDEKQYINNMRDKTNRIIINPNFTLNTNDDVRIINDKNNIGKRRSNLSKEYYKIDSLQGYGYLIRSKDNSVAYYPRHKLVKGKTNKYAETLDNGGYGTIKQIISYDERKDKYKVEYDGGVTDIIPSRNLRENRPTHLGIMELEFWKNKTIPNRLKRFIS